MEAYNVRLEKAQNAIREADAILIGAGAGLSTAAGLEYNGKHFTDNFALFIAKYGFEDLYTSGFYPFKTQEEKWAYWAKHIDLCRYEPQATPLYKELLKVVEHQKYFVITTNVDSQFEKAGFPKDKIFEVQGNYAYFQCATACHDKLYYNESFVNQMVMETKDCKIPSELVPKCPVCGGEMEVNLRKDQYFVQDENWYAAEKRYKEFVTAHLHQKLVLVEIGVGYNTPAVIRYPFEVMTYQNEQVTLIRINKDYAEAMPENVGKTIIFPEKLDIEFLQKIIV